MTYGKSKIKASVSEKENSVYVSGSGSVKSDDYQTARGMSEHLTENVDSCVRDAYRIRRRGQE